MDTEKMLYGVVSTWRLNNSNRTERSPIQSVIIRVINKIGRSWESDLLITSMVIDRIGLHEVLLPVDQNYGKVQEKN